MSVIIIHRTTLRLKLKVGKVEKYMSEVNDKLIRDIPGTQNYTYIFKLQNEYKQVFVNKVIMFHERKCHVQFYNFSNLSLSKLPSSFN